MMACQRRKKRRRRSRSSSGVINSYEEQKNERMKKVKVMINWKKERERGFVCVCTSACVYVCMYVCAIVCVPCIWCACVCVESV